jgi:hypothetical protein
VYIPNVLIKGAKTEKAMEHENGNRKHKHCREVPSRRSMEILNLKIALAM